MEFMLNRSTMIFFFVVVVTLHSPAAERTTDGLRANQTRQSPCCFMPMVSAVERTTHHGLRANQTRQSPCCFMPMVSGHMRRAQAHTRGTQRFTWFYFWSTSTRKTGAITILVQNGLQKALKGNNVLFDKLSDDEKDELLEKAYGQILLFFSDGVLRKIVQEKTAASIWQKSENLYITKSLTNRLYRKNQLSTLQMQKVPNSIEDGLLEAMNEAQFPIIATANSSAGFPYFVSLAANVYSYEIDITNPSPENERNMKSAPSLASHEYFAEMNNPMEAFGRDKLIRNHEQASIQVVGNAIVTTATLNCSEFIGEGDFMEMNTMGDYTYLAVFFFTIFCLCFLSIFMTRCFPGKLVDKEGTTGYHQDAKSEIFISLLLSVTTVLLILFSGNSRSQLEGGILKSNHKFQGVHLTRTIFAVAANLPYKVSGKFYPYENHTDNKGYYDEPNDKNGRTDVKLRMLIPMKNTFHEFVKVDRDAKGNGMTATGFSVDLFKEVMNCLPYRVSYEFIPYESTNSLDMGYYDELILQLRLKRYNGVVGDITVTSSRSKSGDFTQPYMIAGVCMIVPIVDNEELSLWWFLKPFTWDLWLVIIALFLSKGPLVWFFERGYNNPEFERSTFLEQVETILSFSFSIFLFELWEKPKSRYSRLVVILWIAAMFILTGAYGAILQGMLSPNNDGPIVTTIEQLIMNEDYVGYQKGSIVFNLLKHAGFQEEKLKAYNSINEYATALSRGSSNNGVSAIVDEIPYAKVFLAKYADRYTMVRLTLSSSGFALLFQRGSTIVTDVSTIILEFIEGNKMSELEKKWFGSLEPNASPPKTQQSGRRLTTYDFRGVLLITAPVLCFSFLIFIVVKIPKYWKTMTNPSNNKAVEGSNTEESSNNSLSRSHTDGNPTNREGESGQFQPNDTDIGARDSSDDGHHINIPLQNISDDAIPPQNISDDVEMNRM